MASNDLVDLWQCIGLFLLYCDLLSMESQPIFALWSSDNWWSVRDVKCCSYTYVYKHLEGEAYKIYLGKYSLNMETLTWGVFFLTIFLVTFLLMRT